MSDNQKKEYAVSMANTIWKSLFCSIDLRVIMSWGIGEKIATYYKNMPALCLNVDGMIHKGMVVVTYNEGVDYFEAYFFNKQGECIKTIEDICFDELGGILDEEIEKPKDMSDEVYQQQSWQENMKNIVAAK